MLDRHFDVLEHVIAEHPTGIVNLSKDLGYPHHKVRYSLRMLENEARVTTKDRFGVIGTGFALMLAGCGGVYLTLK